MEIEGLHLLELDFQCACLMQLEFQNSNLPDLEMEIVTYWSWMCEAITY